MQAEKLIENNQYVYDVNSENIYFPRSINQYPDYTQMPFIPNPYFMARTHYDEEFFQDPDVTIKEVETKSEDFRHKESIEEYVQEEIYPFEYESRTYQNSYEDQIFNQMDEYNPYNTQYNMPYNYQYPMFNFNPYFRFFIY